MCYNLLVFANSFLFGENLDIERKDCFGTAEEGGEKKRWYLFKTMWYLRILNYL